MMFCLHLSKVIPFFFISLYFIYMSMIALTAVQHIRANWQPVLVAVSGSPIQYFSDFLPDNQHGISMILQHIRLFWGAPERCLTCYYVHSPFSFYLTGCTIFWFVTLNDILSFATKVISSRMKKSCRLCLKFKFWNTHSVQPHFLVRHSGLSMTQLLPNFLVLFLTTTHL